MLIRVSGYNNGGKEYLEEGRKNGRELSRDELDERVILDGDLGLTQMVYQQIPDKGQERYATFTLSFREDEIPNETLLEITKEFKQFLMYAYEEDEYNFYAEAHLPKVKETIDKKTGEKVERKPHVHIFVPRKNLLTGKEMNPRGMFDSNVKYFEAFQEYINQKYNLASPREHVRVDPTNVADVLSRYKGDDFRTKNQSFKKQLVKDIIEKDIVTRESFYAYVSTFGETKIRNKGKANEYIAVKLPDDKKFTNLKETIFHDDFIVNREIKKPPLDKAIISARFAEWPQRAKEIKYVSKATPKFRQLYKDASAEQKITMLAQRQNEFYEKNRGRYELHPAKWQRSNQRSADETGRIGFTKSPDGLQSLSGGDVATDRNYREAERSVLLPGDAHIHMGQQNPGRDSRLRHDLSGRRGRRNTGEYDFDKHARVHGIPSLTSFAQRRGYRLRGGFGGLDAESINLPPHALNPKKIASVEDIQKRAVRLFGKSNVKDSTNRVSPIRRVMPKKDKNASFVAAYFLRRMEENSIQPSLRREMREIDKKFYDTRRFIATDERLTRTEKKQIISVLTFERIKAHHALKHPNEYFELENDNMGSEDIRKLVKGKRIPENSITKGEAAAEPQNAKARFARIIKNVNEHVAEQRARERQRTITANDLYTKRAKLSQNIHYLDKKTDRTMFVDTGRAIALRKSGMTASAVVVALELAKEKFGSTLTINGSKQFKEQVIEAVAKNNLDIHFTDKAMNKRLAERKEELAIERSGNSVEMPEPTINAVREMKDISPEVVSSVNASILQDSLPGTAGVKHDAETNQYEVLVASKEEGEVFCFAMSPSEETATRIATLINDHDPEHLASAMRNELSQELKSETATQPAQTSQPEKSSESIYEGELVEHGAAPYKFKPDMAKPEGERNDSYYVTLRHADGSERTLWGVGLEDAVQQFNVGEKIKLEDKGVVPVKWTETLKDGSSVEKSGQRRTWEGSLVGRERDQNDSVNYQNHEDYDGPGVA
ncbi:TPA: molybdopterin-guanine dinucleotide biosynthesis protein MobB [Escherichia coli]|nr:molybdopterin-guanine dinucleotide biosynthesis protein MobB [Escherichia coli]